MKPRHIKLVAILIGFGLMGCAPDVSTPKNVPSETAHAEHDRMGSHGMVMLGSTDVSLYHLALYRRPHDRQILTPASFASKVDQENFEVWKRNYKDIVTIVPTNFDLDRLDPNAKDLISAFDADIYEGHFDMKVILSAAGR